MRYKAAIIGTGKVAGLLDRPKKGNKIDSHAQAYSKTKGIDLVAACDTNATSLRKFSQRWKVKNKYKRAKDLLAENKVDVISLCTPAATHSPLAKFILEHKNSPRILLVEKPLCLNKKELIAIDKILAKTGSKLIVNHKYRFNRGLLKVASMISKGVFGNILEIKTVYYGGFLNNGVHVIDTLRMLTDSELEAKTVRVGAKGRSTDACLDAKLLVKRYPSAEVSLESVDEKYYQLYEIEIRCQKGRIRIMDFARDICIDKVSLNSIGTKELKFVNRISEINEVSSLSLSLFEEIAKFLDGNGKNLLSNVGFDQVSKTMMTLWKLKERARN